MKKWVVFIIVFVFMGFFVKNSYAWEVDDIVPEVDILFAFDTTAGSSYRLLNTAENKFYELMFELDKLFEKKASFGIVEFRDYFFKPYRDPYGKEKDFPYKLWTGLGSSKEIMMSTIYHMNNETNGYKNGNGGKDPDSYLRVMYEAYSDEHILWREDAKKILVFFGDTYGHNPDPGRELKYDVKLEDVIPELRNRKIAILFLNDDFDKICKVNNDWAELVNTLYGGVKNGSDVACIGSEEGDFISGVVSSLQSVVEKSGISKKETSTCLSCKAVGDYNCDGVVNGLDYTWWKQEFVDKLQHEGKWQASHDCSEKITSEDYSRWRYNYLN